jgi:hypothetical protein
VPASPVLELEYVPSVEDIKAAIREVAAY